MELQEIREKLDKGISENELSDIISKIVRSDINKDIQSLSSLFMCDSLNSSKANQKDYFNFLNKSIFPDFCITYGENVTDYNMSNERKEQLKRDFIKISHDQYGLSFNSDCLYSNTGFFQYQDSSLILNVAGENIFKVIQAVYDKFKEENISCTFKIPFIPEFENGYVDSITLAVNPTEIKKAITALESLDKEILDLINKPSPMYVSISDKIGYDYIVPFESVRRSYLLMEEIANKTHGVVDEMVKANPKEVIKPNGEKISTFRNKTQNSLYADLKSLIRFVDLHPTAENLVIEDIVSQMADSVSYFNANMFSPVIGEMTLDTPIEGDSLLASMQEELNDILVDYNVETNGVTASDIEGMPIDDAVGEEVQDENIEDKLNDLLSSVNQEVEENLGEYIDLENNEEEVISENDEFNLEQVELMDFNVQTPDITIDEEQVENEEYLPIENEESTEVDIEYVQASEEVNENNSSDELTEISLDSLEQTAVLTDELAKIADEEVVLTSEPAELSDESQLVNVADLSKDEIEDLKSQLDAFIGVPEQIDDVFSNMPEDPEVLTDDEKDNIVNSQLDIGISNEKILEYSALIGDTNILSELIPGTENTYLSYFEKYMLLNRIKPNRKYILHDGNSLTGDEFVQQNLIPYIQNHGEVELGVILKEFGIEYIMDVENEDKKPTLGEKIKGLFKSKK